MKILPALLGLTLTAALSVGGVQATASAETQSAAEEVRSVSGHVTAYSITDMALCTKSCIFDGWLGGQAGSDPAGFMGEPEFYKMPDSPNGNFKTQSSSVDAGTYAIAFTGADYRFHAVSGYFKRMASGKFKVVSNFADATKFTLTDEGVIDLGEFNIQSSFAASVQTDVLYSSGGSAWTEVNFKNVPRGTTIVIKSSGCNKVRTYHKFKKSGTFNWTWTDNLASRHYSRTLNLRATLSKPGLQAKNYRLGGWNVSRHNWHCS